MGSIGEVLGKSLEVMIGSSERRVQMLLPGKPRNAVRESADLATFKAIDLDEHGDNVFKRLYMELHRLAIHVTFLANVVGCQQTQRFSIGRELQLSIMNPK